MTVREIFLQRYGLGTKNDQLDFGTDPDVDMDPERICTLYQHSVER